jgi:hypothetical protein
MAKKVKNVYLTVVDGGETTVLLRDEEVHY